MMYNTLLQITKFMTSQIPQPSTPPPQPTIPQPSSPIPQPLLPWYMQQVQWPSYRHHELVSPPLTPQITPLLSENSEHDLENPEHHMKIFTITKEVVGLQVEVNFWETTNTIREVNSMVVPLKMHDVVLMNRAESWREWDKFDPLFSKGNPVTSYPDLNMKIVLWNVRGATRNEFIPHAWEVIAAHKPNIFILLETKSDGNRASQVSKLLGFDGFQFINPNGLRGGIWLMYKNSVELTDYQDNHARNYFHALFKFSPDSKEVLLTAVHAPSSPTERHRLWNELRNNLPPDDTPWLFLGDLNEVTKQSEKSGGLRFKQSQCSDLNRLAEAACLVDLGFSGNPFTWHNAREGLDLIQEILDRALGNPSWLNTYPNTQGQVDTPSSSFGSSNRIWAPPQAGHFKLNTDGS
ncbi:uncharacterized protein LOC110703402 [Chenopodium quinoa]|uniref:uncharacterized protein LOC110703402 n=1 Tax=Chenopodium quinoa TaxID=63459 RepID=UPI000B76D41D|nr:uncharacterized protein LOC110703402 [Chenopodium quinoa]